MMRNYKAWYHDKLVKTSGALFIATMITSVTNYAFQILMGRLLSPTEYGLMNALLSIFMIMAVPIATLLMVISKKTAEYKARNEITHIKHLFAAASVRIFISGVLGLIIFLLLAPSIRDYIHAPTLTPIILLGASIFTGLAFPINAAILQGIQNYRWLSITQSVAGPAKLVFCALFVLLGFSINGVMGGLIFTGLFLWILSYMPIHKYFRNVPIPTAQPEHLSYAQVIPVLLANLAFAVLTQADIIFVSRYFSPHDAGMYSAAAILGKAVMYIPGAIVLAMFPMVSEQFALNRSGRHLFAKSLMLTLCISGVGAILFFLFPNPLISIIYGTRYQDAAVILKYYGIAMLPMALLMVLMNYLIAQGKKLFAYVMIVGAIGLVAVVFSWNYSLLFIVAAMLIISFSLFLAGVLLQYASIYYPGVKFLQ